MNPVRRLVLLALIAVMGVAASMPSAMSRENETFGVTPYPEDADGVDRGAFRIPLETGETFEDAIRIYNRTVQEIDLTVYAADAEAGSGESDIAPLTVGLRSDEPTGLGSWIDLSRESVQLAPRDEVIISFRVNVKSADPKPANGAIVVETQGTGSGSARREFLTVLSAPGGTETTSERIRPLLLRSPWIIVAMLGLVVAIALVWIGARRARRPKDVLVPAGEIDQPEIEDDIPEASRPVIKRLGASETEASAPRRTLTPTVLDRPRRATRGSVPLIEDAFLVEVEDEEHFDEAETDDDDDDTAAPLVMSDDTDDDTGSLDEMDEEGEEGDDDVDLPPAKHRPAAKRSSRTTSKTSAATKERSTSKKKPARPAKKPTSNRRKPPAKKKTSATKSKAKTKATPRSRASKRSIPRGGYIPLDDL